MKNIFLAITFAISSITINAQNEIDALRYSTQHLTGTARLSAMGGAFGALGGDFSSLSSNPAGLGMYQFSEITFTPLLIINSTKSYYNNNNLTSYKSELSIGNVGVIFTMPQKKSEWKRINLGIGWNQLANYNDKITIEGVNYESSIVDQIISITNGTLVGEITNGQGNLYSEMAWNTYLIDPLFDNNVLVDGEYVSNLSAQNKIQSKVITKIGDMNELVFSIGGSYKEKLYLGATIGIPQIDYYEYSEYTEKLFSDTTNNLRQMLLSEEISAYGTGINIKLGAIYRLTEQLKIGGSIHTPTFLNIEEDYNTSITTFFKDSTLEYSMGYIMPFNYDLITPLKAAISASTIFNNLLISAEYELIDYTKSEYLTTNFDNENLTIASIYQKTQNMKIGAEMNIKPFVIRTGYSKYESPFINKDFSRENFSYGIGINNGSYFIDLAYILSQRKSEHQLYSTEYIETINLVTTNHNLLFTIGFRF